MAEGAGLAEQKLVRQHAERPQVTRRAPAAATPLLGRQVALGADPREVTAGGRARVARGQPRAEPLGSTEVGQLDMTLGGIVSK